MYKQTFIYGTTIVEQNSVQYISETGFTAFIPFDPANTDYQQFKQAINDDTAQLEDADGNLMTTEESKAFVSELP